jgi:glutamate/tyrosine decarboxylase-like PLP-dependent enzyme
VSKHNSPILIEVALFFKSTSRNTRAMASRIPAFDFDALDQAAKKAAEYLQKVRSRPVAPSPAAVLDLAQFDEPLPETPVDACSVVEILDRLGAPATVANAGGRFFGFVNGGALPVAVAAAWIASAWDQNVALRVMSPAAAALEDVAIRWVRDALGLPCECGGSIVTGASLANLTGLAAARHALLKRSGWDAENDGLFAAPQLTVVVGEQVHASLLKALGLLGLGRKRVIRVPADQQGRIRVDGMPALNDRTIVCIQAGNVNSGAFDPARAICEPGNRSDWKLRTST